MYFGQRKLTAFFFFFLQTICRNFLLCRVLQKHSLLEIVIFNPFSLLFVLACDWKLDSRLLLKSYSVTLSYKIQNWRWVLWVVLSMWERWEPHFPSLYEYVVKFTSSLTWHGIWKTEVKKPFLCLEAR